MAERDEFERDVARQRSYLVRYASVQLRDASAVEDAVQETLVAALQARDSFAGRSNLRTWLTGILKHKIIDAIRRATREAPIAQDEEGEPVIDALFKQNGHWVEHPAAWTDPDAALEQAQFYQALERCLAALPAKAARVFLMREHLGADTQEICRELAINPNYCNVLLYRARMALQACLQESWFKS